MLVLQVQLEEKQRAARRKREMEMSEAIASQTEDGELRRISHSLNFDVFCAYAQVLNAWFLRGDMNIHDPNSKGPSRNSEETR